MSRLLLISVLLIAVVGGAWAWTKIQGPEPPRSSEPIAAPKRTIETKPWDGSGVRSYTTTFIHGSQLIDLQRVSYEGLNLPTANLAVEFKTNRTQNGSAPRFVRPESFQLVSSAGETWTPKIETAPEGQETQVRLGFTKVPTDKLGAGDLVLYITKPQGGRFAVVLVPPPAPAGHDYAEDEPAPPAVDPAVAAKVKKGVQAWAKAWRSGKAATYCKAISTQALRELGGAQKCRTTYNRRLKANAPKKVVVTKIKLDGKRAIVNLQVTRKKKTNSQAVFAPQRGAYRYVRHLQ